MNGLDPIALPKASVLRRLVPGARRDHAAIEIHNVLAERPIASVTPDEIAAILARYKVTPDAIEPKLTELFATVLKHRLEDQDYSEEDRADLPHLQRALHLADSTVAAARATALEGVYRDILARALQDGRHADDEEYEMAFARVALGLSKSEAERIYADAARCLWTRGRWSVQLASDVIRDGPGVELLSEESGTVAAEIFRCDADRSISMTLWATDIPADILAWFGAVARLDLGTSYEDGSPIDWRQVP